MHARRTLRALGAAFGLALAIPVVAEASPKAIDAHPALSQRSANYEMHVRLVPEERIVHGRQILEWTNTTNTPTRELHYHLYYNAWRNEHSSFLRQPNPRRRRSQKPRDHEWAYSEVRAIAALRADGTRSELRDRAEFIQPDDGNPHDRTVLRVPLPEDVGPGETVRIELEFEARVPRTFARTGVRGDYYFLAQWFPKVGVFESDGEWNCHQFIKTEFFADFGVYDVHLTVPSGWVVGATGRERSRTDNPDGTTTHHYYQADVHDFAWTTSPDFVVHERHFAVEGLPEVDMRLLSRPERQDLVSRYFDATEAALEHYGKWWGAYPYDHITIVDPAYGSRTGGMEYPTFFTGGGRWLSPKATRSPEGVTIHEAGHQFWYGLIANNEFEHAWLDEGFNTYSTTRTLIAAFPDHHYVKRYFGGFLPVEFPSLVMAERMAGADRYRGFESVLKLDPQATHSHATGPRSYRVNAYNKGAWSLQTLENFLGWPTFQKVMSTYFARYRFEHPTPQDFFEVVNEVSGHDLGWYFDQVWRDSVVFDYGVGRVHSRKIGKASGITDEEDTRASEPAGKFSSEVYVRRWGEGRFPVEIEVEFGDDSKRRVRWDGQARWHRFEFVTDSPVQAVRVDPEHVLTLDLNSTNDSWTKRPKASEAATKWSSKWMVWLQSTFELFAFFI